MVSALFFGWYMVLHRASVLKAVCVGWPLLWLAPLALAWPLSVSVSPPGHEPWVLWASDWIGRWHGAAVLLNGLGTLLVGGWIWRQSGRLAPDQCRNIRWFSPLLLIALLFPFLLMKDLWPGGWVGNVLFYGPLFAVSFPLSHALHRWTERDDSPLTGRQPVWIVAIGTALFWLTGMAYTHWCGEHAGDEGHYIIQAASLYHDGDLDIQNQYEEILGERLEYYKKAKLLGHRLHVSPSSRDGRWYSYHTPGLSFLTMWTVPLGIGARHLVLGLIAGLALGGVYLLCRFVGAGHRASVILLALYATSLYGVVYASRYLPEVMGATLISWMLVAIMVQDRRPVISVLLGACMVAALPWGHLRFLPMALLAAGFYGLYGLFIKENILRKGIRLAAFTVLAGCGLGFYRYWQHVFLEGGYSHPVGSMFMSHPQGILRIFTDPARFADVFPLAVWLVPCGFLGWRLNREQRPLLLMLPSLFLVTWIITCSARNYGGGATLAGRFLVSVIPLLLPAAALYWGKSTWTMRWWMLVLALVSIGLSLLQLAILPSLGRDFAYPYDTIPRILTALWGWHLPWPDPRFIYAGVAVHALVVAWDKPLRPWAPWLVGGLLLALLWEHAHGAGRPSSHPVHDRGLAAKELFRLDLDRVRVHARHESEPVRLFTISNMLVDRYGEQDPLRVTTEKLEAVHVDDTISQALIEVNDWAGRNRRWATLSNPVKYGVGEWVFAVTGQISGGSVPTIAIREGSRTIVEETLDVDRLGRVTFLHRFHIESRHSLLYLLLHLEGDGEILLEELALSPVSDRLLQQGALGL